ncbi:uncharacterized protein [Petaurus breviceps papuanus]|uniref:uncharacterized protein n=1 Tax=Petaurus breviceps papuanus TaxID=3040969 RepID=UPI0036D7BDE1
MDSLGLGRSRARHRLSLPLAGFGKPPERTERGGMGRMAQRTAVGRSFIHSSSSLFSLQTAPLPRSFCIPQIILTKCASNPPSPPEVMPEETHTRIMPIPLPQALVSAGRSTVTNQCQAPPLGQNKTGAELVVMRPQAEADACPPRSTKTSRQGEESLKTVGTKGQAPTEGTIRQVVAEKGARMPCHRGEGPDGSQCPGIFVGAALAVVSPEETIIHSGHNTHIPIGECAERTVPQTQSGKGPLGQDSAERDTSPWLPFQRLDSLEETLQELEATLNAMVKASSASPIGTLSGIPSQPPSSQVFALSCVLSCFHTFLPSLLLSCGKWEDGGDLNPPPPALGLILLAL